MAESALPPPPAKASLRERERDLDARSSALDTHTDIGLAETLAVIRRVLVTFWPLAPVRLAVKALLQMGALGSVALLLPWQAKAVIDHVVLAKPIVTTGYPPYLHPVLHWLDGMHPLEILVALSTIAVGMVLTLGYYASGGARDDGVEAGMEQGHDIATRHRERHEPRLQPQRRAVGLRRVHPAVATVPGGQPRAPVPALQPPCGAVDDAARGPAHRRFRVPRDVRHAGRDDDLLRGPCSPRPGR